ncbi:hypothetical protein FCM35_KLT01832 [Carex littledalei]|uniref:Neprosin PEP catalytic domain-containing protein n=1 Tax=Carex littledalei TaxID=544730 RepID=A0A833QS31_9POAL|nr:hypothetical protein FCM35_KLT01832 [Carex littledalei]
MAGYVSYHREYYGSQAKISAWGVPYMNPNSSYEVSVTLLNFNGNHVYPQLYHNNDLRFFILGNDDATKKNACYNLDCPGFVVANSSVLHPGQAVAPLSQYNGEDRYVTLSIKKDSVTEFWTVYREDLGTSSKLGWWKKGFLGDLDMNATSVQWLAFVTYENNDTGPTMGSGHYPNEGKNKAAYMMDLKLFDKAGNVDSPKIQDLIRGDDKPGCYRSLPAVVLDNEIDKHKFYYGGPAGCIND